MNDGAIGLMGGKDEHLCNLHMLGCAGGIESHVGNVVTGERLDAPIDIVGALCVTMEAHIGEVGFHESGLDVGHA